MLVVLVMVGGKNDYLVPSVALFIVHIYHDPI